MAKWNRNIEIELYNSMHDSFMQEYSNWQTSHENWQANGSEVEAEPVEPAVPSDNLIVYESRLVESIEKIETPMGEILVTPGRFIMTGSDGQVFALSQQELALQFTLISVD